MNSHVREKGPDRPQWPALGSVKVAEEALKPCWTWHAAVDCRREIKKGSPHATPPLSSVMSASALSLQRFLVKHGVTMKAVLL